jgi:alginate O-acetyltransferase complex protein AlgI
MTSSWAGNSAAARVSIRSRCDASAASSSSRWWSWSELITRAFTIMSLVLHFGLFDLGGSAWRTAGVAAESHFRASLLSTSLQEFWGRRWNLPFAEMTAAGVYRPFSAAAGRRSGIAAAFLASGILHELAISLPVRSGYGLSLLYFAIHGGAMLAERALEARGTPVSGRAWIGRAWTIAWLLLPLPLLFHPPFLHGVVWPLVGLEQ